MPTFGQAQWLRANVNTVLCLMLIGSFSLGIALLMWQAAYGQNPIANFLAEAVLAREQ